MSFSILFLSGDSSGTENQIGSGCIAAPTPASLVGLRLLMHSFLIAAMLIVHHPAIQQGTRVGRCL